MPGTAVEEPRRQRKVCQSSWHFLTLTVETLQDSRCSRYATGIYQHRMVSGLQRRALGANRAAGPHTVGQRPVCSTGDTKTGREEGAMPGRKLEDFLGPPHLCSAAGPTLGTEGPQNLTQDLPE